MRRVKSKDLKSSRQRPGNSERGVALITTLLLLMLLTGLSMAMVFSVRSDMLINGYYRNFRGSFYAADSGLNAGRTAMVDGVVAAIPATFSITQQPIPPGTDGAIQTNINTTYGQSFTKFTGQGSAASSWPGSYKVTGTFSLDPDPMRACQVLGGSGTCAAPTGPVTGYTYLFNYTLQSIGQAQGSQSTTLTDRGSVTVVAMLIPVNSKTSFAAWGMFIDQSPICDGSTLVAGTISGPVFTNGAWNFGTSGSYIFTDTVGSNAPNAGYQFPNGGPCNQTSAISNKSGGQTIAPTFQGGFQPGQPKLQLPPNDYNQEQAVLDGIGVTTNPVTKAALHNALKDISGNSYPSGGASSGVFLPYSLQGGVQTLNGGGIYIEGNAGVVLSTGTGPSNSLLQIYTITQGGVTTVVKVGNNQTIVTSGGNTQTITGVPHMIDPVTLVASPATMVYDNGSITSLSGPGQGLPAIQDHSAVNITAANNVAITGDLLYKTPPETVTQNQSPALIAGNDTGQALGIFTATGDIQLNNQQANNNLEIDASLATISANGTGGLINVSNTTINTLTIVGGRIQNQLKNINATTRNVFFDRRFSQNGFAPPWFPSTVVTPGSITSAVPTTTVRRVEWQNQSSYF